MRRNVDIRTYWPEVVGSTYEFNAIAESENPEINALWIVWNDVMKDQFVESLTIDGIKRWEKNLKITPYADDTLADRRYRIKVRLNETLPYTYRTVYRMLENLCGKDGFTFEVQHNIYVVTVKIALVAKKMFNSVADLLRRILPANMIIHVEIMYNQHSTLGRYTHAQLKAYTHDQLRNEVIRIGNSNN